MTEQQVTTLEQLRELAEQRRAVTFFEGTFKRVLPAAFVINMAGAKILNMFCAGMYVYQKRTSETDTSEVNHE